MRDGITLLRTMHSDKHGAATEVKWNAVGCRESEWQPLARGTTSVPRLGGARASFRSRIDDRVIIALLYQP